MKKRKERKKPNSKKVLSKDPIWSNNEWTVFKGELKRPPGRPSKQQALFSYVGEMLPFDSLAQIKRSMDGAEKKGVYLAHDSMGTARYGGRGDIFTRLATHRDKYPKQLIYFSFYVVAESSHRREIETAIIRAASGQLTLNQRKVVNGINPGNVLDYEPGTKIFERQNHRGRSPQERKRKAQ